MDSLLQVQESDNKMYQLISEQRAAMEQETVDAMMRAGAFSLDRLDAMGASVKLDQQQKSRMKDFQSRQKQYEKEFQKLRKRKDTAEGMAAYFEKLIQMEQNTMEMRLLKASVLGEGAVAQRVKAESLYRINTYREAVLSYYKIQAEQGQQKERRDQLKDELLKGKEAQREAAAAYDLSMITTAALDRIERERREKKDDAALMQEFLAADYSTRTLEAGYVIQNMDTCLHNVELIRRMRRMVFTGDDAAKVIRKLEAVGEYANVVESWLWKHGMRIDYDALQIREIDPNDETFAGKRRAFAENGALRYYLSIKKYNRFKKHGQEPPEEEQQMPEQTRVEETLSAVEAHFHLSFFREEDMRILKSAARSVGRVGRAKTGHVIRASAIEAQGKMNHVQIKMRFFKIYQAMKEKLTDKLGEDAKAFQSLQTLVERYVYTNRDTYVNRAAAEKLEAKVLRALKRSLIKIKNGVRNKSSRYAAILLGMLTRENNGYLEVPPGEIHIVEDENIILKDQEVKGVKKACKYQDRTNIPLFTHRPNIKDIAQGGLGDCYLLAGLISVVDQNAEEIMNIMKDNGDGTVTVCFKREETDASGNKVYTPCYTTVRKTVPVLEENERDVFSRGALWVKMMEKAYVASGLHIFHQINQERAKKWRRQLSYRDLQKEIESGRRKVEYKEIEGGRSGEFISLLLGKKSETHFLAKNRAEHVGDRIGRMLPEVSTPGWDASAARKFGDESVDSIVYEYIKKQDQIKAQRFLSLQKPGAPGRQDDTIMAQYRAEKEELQKYRRTCILNLDIVETLAREKGVDMLQLKTDEEIKKFYDEIKEIFLKSCNKTATGAAADDKEIVERVVGYYVTADFNTRFLPVSVKQFNDTLDILQERHIAMLRRKQAGGAGAGAGAGAVVRAPQDYYSARDLKLFGKIEAALQSGAYIAFGTRKLSNQNTGKNGESELGGMVGTHAYAIINTRRIMVNNEERLFVVVMNPWAEKGLIYNVEATELKERAIQGKKDGEKEEGVFCLELRRFAEIVTDWDIVAA